LPLQLLRDLYIVERFVVEVNNFTAFYAAKMLMILKSTVIPARLAGSLDLKRRPNLG
jgi:hypothetical protein